MAVVGRILGVVLGLVLLGAGGLGLAFEYAPDSPVVASGEALLAQLAPLLEGVGVGMDQKGARTFLGDPVLRLVLPGLGLFLLVSSVWRRGAKKAADAPADPDRPLSEAEENAQNLDRSAKKHFAKEARGLVKAGQLVEAAEIYRDAGEIDKAVTVLEEAERFDRAAEMRREQGDLEAAAQFYLRAGRSDHAALAWSEAGQFAKAAQCYLERGQHGMAAEMFEQAGMWREAGDAHQENGFHRHAARAYVKCQAWEPAAVALEEVLNEEFVRVGSGQDPKKAKEHRKIVLQTAKLYREAKRVEDAQRVLEKGGCFAQAGEIAMKRQDWEQAADLFLRGEEPERAAEALRQLGRDSEANRLLGEHYRDHGDQQEAARLLMEAGDHEQAGDIYRKLEEYLRAGECFEQAGDHHAAAEMFRAAGDVTRAAVGYEGAGDWSDAAACWEEIGDEAHLAHALEQAGRLLEAGRLYQKLERDDDAVRVLQRIGGDHPEFRDASAMLGAFFHRQGMFAVAIKKLRQACDGQDIDAGTVQLFYELARVHEDNGDVRESVDLFERILAYDMQYEDAAKRLETVRKRAQIEAAAAAASTSSPGRRSSDNRYRIVGELGRGGMGIVYKAVDTVLDREVAYKVLPEALKENAKALENFLREAKSAAQLNHPNIVTVYDAGEQGGQYYIAMEFVDGTTLKEIVRRKGVIKPRGVLHVLAQMCEALEFAHSKGIVHRDIKTANTMWTRDKKAKIMDFGLAKAIEEVRNHTTMVSGTPFYMSPEQTLGKNIDHRTDLYSLGVSIFEMATGRVPFREGNVPYHHVHTPPPDPCEVNPKLPKLLGRVISRCLEKDPADRYQTAGEIVAEVKAALARKDGGATKA